MGRETDVQVNTDGKCIGLPGEQKRSEIVWKTSIRAELFHCYSYLNGLFALDQLPDGLINQPEIVAQ